MNYELKSSINRKKVSTPIRFVIILATILLILYFVFPHLLSSLFSTMVKPVWNIGNNRNINTETESAVIKELQKENSDLKEILGRSTNKNFVLGVILKKPPFSAYDIFVLDIGTVNGVRTGDKVYAYGHILIGEIIETSRLMSKVKLYSSYGERFEVSIGEKYIQASSTGKGGGAFEALLPRDTDVKEGDNVIIPSITTNIFGRVEKILTDPARPFSTILFSQPFNLYELKWVQVEIIKNE